MGEKLKIFVDFFDKKVDYLIEDAQTDLLEFKNARKIAISSTSPGIDKYKTAGELMANVISEKGELNSDLYKDLFSQLTLETFDKAAFSIMFRRKYAPGRYIRSVGLKGQGEAFFNTAMQAIGSALRAAAASKISFKEIIGDGSDAALYKFNEILQESDEFDDALSADYSSIYESVLRGKSQGREFYDAAIENGDPIAQAAAAAPAAINPATPTGTESGTAPINAPTGEKAGVSETSTVNPVKSAPTETAVEKTTGTVTAAQPSIPKEAVTPAPNTEVNVSITPPAATSPITPTVSPAPAPAASTVSPITPTAGSAPAPAASTVSPLNERPVTAEPATASIIGTSTVNSTTNVSNLTENKKVEGSVGPVTEVKTTSQTLNSPTTTNTTVGATSESTINQAKTETTVDAKKAPDTTINSSKSTNTATSLVGQSSQSSLFNKYFKSILSPEDKKTAEPVTEKSGTTTSLPATPEPAAEVTQTEVSKTPPSFPEKIQPSSEKIIEKANTKVLEKTQEMMNQKELIKSEEKTEYAAPVSVTESKGSAPDTGKSESPKPAAGTSMAGVEARLARLEYLLSNPLEVKIIE